MLENLKIISAGAGSGKTYRLTQEMADLLTSRTVRPAGIIATTFTKRAAAELNERVRVKLLREGMTREAGELAGALIGTVHGLGVKLLRRFAYEAGVSPQIDIIADGDNQRLFNLSMAQVIEMDRIERIEQLCESLSLSQNGEKYNWRGDVRQLVEIIRGNNFGKEEIAESRRRNWESLRTFLPPLRDDLTLRQYYTRSERVLSETYAALTQNEADGTKKTTEGAERLRQYLIRLKRYGRLSWADFADMASFTKHVGAKSRELIEELVAHGAAHTTLAAFQNELREYQDLMYTCAQTAIAEYDRYKKSRGRIDYQDMEVLVLELLDKPGVRATLAEEIDLLMVDEFQDTSPMQLAIFLKLSELAGQSIWVGDPKQSIYGFRGAEPRLMDAVIRANGAIDPRNIQKNSWRSREDIIYACNSLFVAAFPEMSCEEVALDPVRRREGSEFSPAESVHFGEQSGLHHWHFSIEGRYRGQALDEALAKAIYEQLQNPPPTLPKGGREERPLRPGDIAVLCRTNVGCARMAAALTKQGIATAIARKGLLQTAEATFLLACLKYMLNPGDSLCIAEIMLYGGGQSLAEVVNHRLKYLLRHREEESDTEAPPWACEEELLTVLEGLRGTTAEYSTSEMLDIVLERIGLRRLAVSWGDGEQRLSNIDELRRLAAAYEDQCHHQHSAASLGGFLLYLNQLARQKGDAQGASQQADAVNILTYHASKGLEWPAVVCHDLDSKPRAEVWGRAVLPFDTEAPVDLQRPLAGRWLRFWVYPYGRAKPTLDWLAALEESDAKLEAEARARAEEARLLYVGLTRARDYLILPTGKNGAPWVDRAYARSGKQTTVLAPDTHETPFHWNGRDIDKRYQHWHEPRSQPARELRPAAVAFIDGQRPGRQHHTCLQVDEEFLKQRYGRGGGPSDVYSYAAVTPDPAADPRAYGRCLTQLITQGYAPDSTPLAGPTKPAEGYRLELAARLLEDYLPGVPCDPAVLLERATAFHRFTQTHWPEARVLRERPLRTVVDRRHYDCVLDWIAEQDEAGDVLIQHLHVTPGQHKQQADVHLAELRLQTEAYRKLTGRPVAASYLHLPASATLLRL